MRQLFRRCIGITCIVGSITVGTVNTSYATPNTSSYGASTLSRYTLSQEDIERLVYARAAIHGANAETLLCVLRRESRLNPNFVGSHGEVGLAQWLPGRGNAWDSTLAYRVSGISIFREYDLGNPDAIYFDVDAIAEMFARGYAVRRAHWYSTLRLCE